MQHVGIYAMYCCGFAKEESEKSVLTFLIGLNNCAYNSMERSLYGSKQNKTGVI